MILPFDELDILETKYNMPFLEGIDEDVLINDIYDLLIAAYLYGVNDVNEMLGTELKADPMKGEKIIFKKVDGKTWLDRIGKYFDDAFANEYGEYYVMISGQQTSLSDAAMRIAETETTRVFNETMLDLAIEVEILFEDGKDPTEPAPVTPPEETDGRRPRVLKKWNTMEDEKVRLSHAVLQNAEVGVRDFFYTIDGDRAKAPGQFGTAQNNVNCRCWLTYRTVR